MFARCHAGPRGSPEHLRLARPDTAEASEELTEAARAVAAATSSVVVVHNLKSVEFNHRRVNPPSGVPNPPPQDVVEGVKVPMPFLAGERLLRKLLREPGEIVEAMAVDLRLRVVWSPPEVSEAPALNAPRRQPSAVGLRWTRTDDLEQRHRFSRASNFGALTAFRSSIRLPSRSLV